MKDLCGELVVDDKEMGFWHFESKNCPLLPHLKALGEKPRPCVSGLATNVQGAVPIGSCDHKHGEIEEVNSKLVVHCAHDKEMCADA